MENNNKKINYFVFRMIPILLATILIWRGLWNLVDSLVPINTKYDVISLMIGLLIIYYLDAPDSVA